MSEIQRIEYGVRHFFGSLNRITHVVESSCNDKWSVLVKTALPAVNDTLHLLFIPSPKRLLLDYLEPGAARGGRKGALVSEAGRLEDADGELKWWRKLMPRDVNRAIAARIPGRGYFKGRVVNKGEAFLWDGLDLSAEIGWYWLLVDAGDTFVTHWASGIMQSRFCAAPMNREFYAQPIATDLGAYSAAWDIPENANVTTNLGWTVHNNGRITGPLCSGHVVVGADFQVDKPPSNGWIDVYVIADLYVNGTQQKRFEQHSRLDKSNPDVSLNASGDGSADEIRFYIEASVPRSGTMDSKVVQCFMQT